jgi:hypothetical protein
MDREQVREWMKGRRLTNRTLAELLGITEDKVSKSLSTNGKPRLWKGDEALRLAELMREDAPKVRTEVRGTGLSPAQLRDAAGIPQAERIKVLGTAFGGEWTDDIDVETTELHLDQVIDLIDRPPRRDFSACL